MKRCLALLGTVAAVSLAPLSAARAQGRADQAQPAAVDEVILKNGGLVRGSLVSLDPGKEVIITLQGTTQTRTIPWAEVDKVNRGTSVAPAPVAPQQPAAPTGYGQPAIGAGPPVAQALLGAPRIHIDTDSGAVVLHRIDVQFAAIGPQGTAYAVTITPVCQAPCDQVVDGRKGQEFFFGGEGVPESDNFKLTDRTGNVAVKVDPGNSGGRTGGGVLEGLGILGLLTGGTILVVGLAIGSTDSTGAPSDTGPNLVTAGAVTLGASAAALAGGIVLSVASATKVHFPEPAQASTSTGSRVARALLSGRF